MREVIEELKKLGREDIIGIAGGVIPAQDYDFLYKEIPRNLVHTLLIFSVLVFILFIQIPLSVIITVGILLGIFLLTKIIKKSFGLWFGFDTLLLSVISLCIK